MSLREYAVLFKSFKNHGICLGPRAISRGSVPIGIGNCTWSGSVWVGGAAVRSTERSDRALPPCRFVGRKAFGSDLWQPASR